ncbi:MAG: protease inhibitor I42 family protein [Chloroflexota bacterium]
MVNEARLQRKLIVMFGVIPILAFSCVRSGAVTLHARDDGSQVELAEGQSLVISLEGNPTAGCTWETVEYDEQILRQVGEPSFTPESDALGAPGTQVLRFEAVGEGRTTLRLVYHRPWEDAEPERTFSVEVVVG